MAITSRLFGFRRRNRSSSGVCAEVAAEHARDANKSFYSNIEQNMHFEALVLNLMKEKERASGGSVDLALDERPRTESSGGRSLYADGDGVGGGGGDSIAYIAVPGGEESRVVLRS
ncbi:hypothetical protein TWF730_003636 [Orbilia blumenaviensis]|uniref:Uncharacterized protein n=1 Tax=Orbilia blumenaviensis TaxID=1796055 RepID=A0AAV9U326_9PEZI